MSPTDIPPWFAGILFGLACAGGGALYKNMSDRIATLERAKSASDERHNAIEVGQAASRADQAALKDVVGELKGAVQKLSDVVSDLKVAVVK